MLLKCYDKHFIFKDVVLWMLTSTEKILIKYWFLKWALPTYKRKQFSDFHGYNFERKGSFSVRNFKIAWELGWKFRSLEVGLKFLKHKIIFIAMVYDRLNKVSIYLLLYSPWHTQTSKGVLHDLLFDKWFLLLDQLCR